MGLAGYVIKGKLFIKHEGVLYPLIKSNAKAVEAYLHTGDQSYLVALATGRELARYGN